MALGICVRVAIPFSLKRKGKSGAATVRDGRLVARSFFC